MIKTWPSYVCSKVHLKPKIVVASPVSQETRKSRDHTSVGSPGINKHCISLDVQPVKNTYTFGGCSAFSYGTYFFHQWPSVIFLQSLGGKWRGCHMTPSSTWEVMHTTIIDATHHCQWHTKSCAFSVVQTNGKKVDNLLAISIIFETHVITYLRQMCLIRLPCLIKTPIFKWWIIGHGSKKWNQKKTYVEKRKKIGISAQKLLNILDSIIGESIWSFHEPKESSIKKWIGLSYELQNLRRKWLRPQVGFSNRLTLIACCKSYEKWV